MQQVKQFTGCLAVELDGLTYFVWDRAVFGANSVELKVSVSV
ncbi:hypothetical protein FRUB_07413 [Fimbriiglobus ruber]|uniref:Uncharacterized protein n=1 Tax=Fimbriiglobus ruber TaxID=1908690 RepID=A0A225DBC7_9BACT|nr:hypothetical protein FRUB_07413 [Fimbriiglobus ruber]